VIEDMAGRHDVSAHTVFVISQSHSVEVCFVPTVSVEQSDLALLSAFDRGGEFAKLEIYSFREPGTGGGSSRRLQGSP